MNRLEAVVLDQLLEVRAAGAEPIDALKAAEGEIMSVATPGLTLDIVRSSVVLSGMRVNVGDYYQRTPSPARSETGSQYGR